MNAIEISTATSDTGVINQVIMKNDGSYYFSSIYCKFGDNEPQLHINRTLSHLTKAQLKYTLSGLQFSQPIMVLKKVRCKWSIC